MNTENAPSKGKTLYSIESNDKGEMVSRKRERKGEKEDPKEAEGQKLCIDPRRPSCETSMHINRWSHLVKIGGNLECLDVWQCTGHDVLERDAWERYKDVIRIGRRRSRRQRR